MEIPAPKLRLETCVLCRGILPRWRGWEYGIEEGLERRRGTTAAGDAVLRLAATPRYGWQRRALAGGTAGVYWLAYGGHAASSVLYRRGRTRRHDAGAFAGAGGRQDRRSGEARGFSARLSR